MALTQQEIDSIREEAEIPEWIIKYYQANYQSSAGKAVAYLFEKLTAERERTKDDLWKDIEDFNRWALNNGWRYVEGVNGHLWEKLERDEHRQVRASYKSTFLLYQMFKFK